MRAGGGSAKGAEWERRVSKDLSLALSGDRRSDFFWRTAMSGGRATIVNRRGSGPRNSAQIGDLCAVDPGGQWMTDTFFIECKFRKDLELTNFLLEDIGYLARYWATAKAEAHKHGRRPMLFARENRRYPMVVMYNQHRLNLGYRKPLEGGGLSDPIPEMLVMQPRATLEDDVGVYWYDALLAAVAAMYGRNHKPVRERLRK